MPSSSWMQRTKQSSNVHGCDIKDGSLGRPRGNRASRPAQYPTDFSAMPEEWMKLLAKTRRAADTYATSGTFAGFGDALP